jgi:transposase-like protein
MPEVEEYPRSWVEFERRFSSEDACREYLELVRWPDGFRCPRCGGAQTRKTGRTGLRECASCHHQATVTAGTIFEATRKPLELWLRAIWLITNQKNGVSAVSLQRQLGLERYETAWVWLHKLRRAMVRPGRDQLSGIVEVDETYVGGEEHGVRGRETLTKTLVLVAAQVDGGGIGRIRLGAVPDASGIPLLGFIEQAIAPGSVVRTDGWEGYRGVTAKGYVHEVVNIAQSGSPAHEALPRVHRIAALLKRWWLGTHQGAIRAVHLDYYLDEFTFRFNRRTSQSRGKLFYRLVQQAVQVDPVWWQTVADGERATDHNI